MGGLLGLFADVLHTFRDIARNALIQGGLLVPRCSGLRVSSANTFGEPEEHTGRWIGCRIGFLASKTLRKAIFDPKKIYELHWAVCKWRYFGQSWKPNFLSCGCQISEMCTDRSRVSFWQAILTFFEDFLPCDALA